MFIEEIAKRLAGIFPDGIPTDFDWAEMSVNPDEDEEVIGEATDDLLRFYQLKHLFQEEVDSACETNLGPVKEIIKSGKPTPEKMLEVIGLVWEHQLGHDHAKLIDGLFWEEIRLACSKSHGFEGIGLRQGRKIVGISPITPITPNFGMMSVEVHVIRL